MRITSHRNRFAPASLISVVSLLSVIVSPAFASTARTLTDAGHRGRQLSVRNVSQHESDERGGGPSKSGTRVGHPQVRPVGAVATTAASALLASTTTPLTFNGDTLAGWAEQAADPNRIQEVPDPDGAGDQVLRFTADNGDIAPLTPTANPRAELNTPMDILKPNVPYWESYEVYVPTSFNVADSYDGWLSLGSPFYGSPFAGTPPIEMMIMDDEFLWGSNRDSQVPGTVLFRKPLVLGQWVRFTWHIFPSNNGFVELYVNNEPVVSTYNGSTGLGVDIPVLDETDDKGPWYAQLSVYYEYGEYPSVTLYFKNFRIASTLAAAAGW